MITMERERVDRKDEALYQALGPSSYLWVSPEKKTRASRITWKPGERDIRNGKLGKKVFQGGGNAHLCQILV